MSDFHMIQMTPNVALATRWAFDYNVAARDGTDDFGYAWHAMLTAAFGEKAPKPFRLAEKAGRAPQILGYSALSAIELRSLAQINADPALYAALGIETLVSKKMPELLPAGGRFGFEIRVRPTSRAERDPKGKERDVYLRALDREGEGAGLDRATVYAEWLSNKLGQLGADVLDIRADRLEQQKVMRRSRGDRRDLRMMSGPDVTMSGIVSVRDAAAFTAAVANGVGRHKAFGFGMLLLKVV